MSVSRIWFNLIRFGFKLESTFDTASTASKNDTFYKSGQK